MILFRENKKTSFGNLFRLAGIIVGTIFPGFLYGQTADFVVKDTIVCVNEEDSIFYSGSSVPTSLIWDFGEGAIPGTGDTIGPYAVFYSTPGEKTITLVTVNPDSSIIHTIQVNPLPVKQTISGADTVCPNAVGEVYQVPDNLDHSYSWSVTGSSSFSGENTNMLSVNWGSGLSGTVNLVETVDSSGCWVESDTIIDISDSDPPVAQCLDITLYLDATGQAVIDSSDLDNGSSDGCGISTITLSKDTFTCVDVGSNSVVLTVTDNNGNSSLCTSIVTVLDTISPNFTVPPDILICAPPDCLYDTEIDTAITGKATGEWDNCTINEATYTDDFSNLTDCNVFGFITRTWKLIDNNGNESSKKQIIYVDPFPNVTLSIEADTLCDNELTNISIFSTSIPEVPVRFMYTYYPDEPDSVKITLNSSKQSDLTTGTLIADQIDNLSRKSQRVMLVVGPYNIDGSGISRCDGFKDTAYIFVNPQPHISVSVEDTLCYQEGTTFTIATLTPAEKYNRHLGL